MAMVFKVFMKKGWQGFTLLELLVTISIIGILIGVASVSFSTAQKRGRDSRRQADMKAMQTSLEQCYALDTQYPASVVKGTPLTCFGAAVTMNLVPSDPKDTGTYVYTYTVVPTTLSGYCICALLENPGAGNAFGVGANGVCSWSGTGTKNYFCVSNQQ